MKLFPIILALVLSTTLAAGQTSAPTTKPELTHEQQVRQLCDFLNDQYAKLLKSPDWIERSLACISLARIPGARAADQLIGVVRNDPTPVVRVVAWQSVLARAKWLDLSQYQAWLDATNGMAKKDLFRGTTRVGLLRTMAINPPTRGAKLAWVGMFGQTNALESRDIPVLDALGDCLLAWKTPDVGEYLFNRLSNLNDAYRAEYVLHRLGVTSPWAAERMDLGSVPMWKLAIDNDRDELRRSRAGWKPMETAAPEAWKKLDPQFVPRPDLEAPIDPNDPLWRKETELGRVDPKPLDVAFVVDATGSMQPVIDFLKRDIGTIKTALELVSSQPRIGITFYRDFGDTFVTRSTRLTDKLATLDTFIGAMDAHGGVDRPEAVREALNDCLKENPWAWKRDGRKVVVLITDAPPHPDSQDDCLKLSKACKDNGISLQIVKVRSGDDQSDLAALDDMAVAAGTEPMWLPIPNRGEPRFELPALFDGTALEATRVAFAPPDDSADRQILKRLLVQAINPNFADRVEPLVDIILALTAPSTPEKRLPFGVPDRPGNAGNADGGGAGGGDGGGMGQRRDPQDR